MPTQPTDPVEEPKYTCPLFLEVEELKGVNDDLEYSLGIIKKERDALKATLDGIIPLFEELKRLCPYQRIAIEEKLAELNTNSA